jgi:hypothetical protein
MTLNDKLNYIGIKVNINNSLENIADIESTFLEAAILACSDLRLASLLFSWLKIHGNYVVVEKLRKLVSKSKLSPLERNWVSAFAVYGEIHCSHKWKSLIQAPEKEAFLLPEGISKSAIKLKGSEEWLTQFRLLLPKNSLRVRSADIEPPAKLVKINRQYRNRYLYGPSWRADIITAIEEGATTPTSVMKKIGCSYEPAHRVFHEYSLACF